MTKYELRDCTKHGTVKFRWHDNGLGSGMWECVKCNNHQSKYRRQRNKRFLVNYLGGKCDECGYDTHLCALDFHHLDPDEKEANATKILNWSREKAVREVDKCILLCSNCHRVLHYKENNIVR